MILLTTPIRSQKKLAENARAKRLELDLTQEGLAERSGVALPTLRKFEQRGAISLESYLKILMALGGLEAVIEATEPAQPSFSSIDEVLNAGNKIPRKRGRRK